MATDPRTSFRVSYETVAAGQTAQALGVTGKTGDLLEHVIIVPTTTAAGNVDVLDGTTSIRVYNTGTLSDLKPFTVVFGCKSVTGAWKITTGSNVAVIAVGQFS